MPSERAFKDFDAIALGRERNEILLYVAAFLSSVAWSLFDFSRKRLTIDLDSISIVIWLMFIQSLFYLPLAGFEAWSLGSMAYWGPALLSIAINILANVFFVQSVALAPLSLSIPVLSMTPVFSSLGSYLLIGETLSFLQFFAIAMIVFATLALKYLGSEVGMSQVHSIAVKKGLGYMFVVSLLWSLTPVLDKIALVHAPAGMHGFYQCIGVGGALYFFQIIRGRVSVPQRSTMRWLIFSGFFAAVALLTQLWVIQTMSVGLFEALKRGVGLIGSLMLGYFFFNEALRVKKIAAIAVIITGVVLLLYQ